MTESASKKVTLKDLDLKKLYEVSNSLQLMALLSETLEKTADNTPSLWSGVRHMIRVGRLAGDIAKSPDLPRLLLNAVREKLPGHERLAYVDALGAALRIQNLAVPFMKLGAFHEVMLGSNLELTQPVLKLLEQFNRPEPGAQNRRQPSSFLDPE